jgi:hypothetical protein
MIRIYERSLCQSYASAYRQGILLAKTDDEAEALSIIESLTDDSYQCFALLEDGTVLDLRGRFLGAWMLSCKEEDRWQPRLTRSSFRSTACW